MEANSFLNDAIYLAENSDVAKAVAEGKYASGREEYEAIGQYQERNGVVFSGTEGNDRIQSSGQKSSVVGVKIKTAKSAGRLITIEAETLGVGELDTLQGSPGRNIFYLGDNATETPQDFYLGNGDQDYALIHFFDPTSEDAIYLAGSPEDYQFETVDSNVQISKNGDLIAIVEGISRLIPDGLFTNKGILLFAPQNAYYARRSQPYFNEPAYLAANPDVKELLDSGEYSSGWDHFMQKGSDEGRQTFFNGVVGNDSFFYPLGNAIVTGMPITEYDPATGAIKTATTGSGDYDHYHGAFGVNRFLVGNAGVDFYVGQGEQDHALIGDFDPKQDELIVAQAIQNYKFEIYEEEFGGEIYPLFQLSTQAGDVIARLEDPELELVQLPSTIPGTYALVSPENERIQQLQASFYEAYYLAANPDVVAAVKQGEYKTGFEQYLKVGQFGESDREIAGLFAGTDGNDTVTGFGSEFLLFGVALTEVDAEQEAYKTGSMGKGEVDTLIGAPGLTTFMIGNDHLLSPETEPAAFYVGNGDADYALIQNFDPLEDFLFTGGTAEDYVFQSVDNNLNISTSDGDLVAVIESGGSLTLKSFTIPERPNGLVLVDATNPILQQLGG
ncbi:MAG: hypothetical protein EDM05_57720 [Leptolyngbya sp. IPPAS B-1204]|nr:hypothetical protein [Elainella sp. C42_A2020_010]